MAKKLDGFPEALNPVGKAPDERPKELKWKQALVFSKEGQKLRLILWDRFHKKTKRGAGKCLKTEG